MFAWIIALTVAAADAQAPSAYLVAVGQSPDWIVYVEQDAIEFRTAHSVIDGPMERYAFPIGRSYEQSNVWIWESLSSGSTIRIEARETGCMTEGSCCGDGESGTLNVRVRLNDRVFVGCGDFIAGPRLRFRG